MPILHGKFDLRHLTTYIVARQIVLSFPSRVTTMFSVLLSSMLALLAGASVVTQQALNADLRTALGSAVWSGFASYAVGLICMAVLSLALRDPMPPFVTIGRIPWWAFSGGMFGAVFVALAIFLIPKLGAATFIVLLVTGQMLASILFDHFGLMGLAHRPVDVSRLFGVALLIGGCVLIRR